MNRCAIVTVLALGASACTSFPDVSTVLDLRVLAVQTDPSEVILKIDGLPSDPSTKIDPSTLSIDPASIPTIHVTPLVADPPAAAAGRAVTWSLSACPNVPYGAAPPSTNTMADPAGGAGTTVGSTLCTEGAPNTWPLASGLAAGATADVTLTPLQLLTAFEADVFLDQYGNVHGGFDLGMPLNLQLTFNDGAETTTAIKRVLFWSHQITADQKVNVIPTIPGVTGYVDRDPSTWLPTSPLLTLDATTPTHVTLGKGMYLLPKYVPLPPAGAPVNPNILLELGRVARLLAVDAPNATPETYVTTVLERDPPYEAIPATETERIRYAFYATAGTFNPPRTVDQNPPGSTPPPNATGTTIHLESQYVTPATVDDVPIDAATGLHLVTIWIVVRDDRGGESWVTYPLALDAPAN